MAKKSKLRTDEDNEPSGDDKIVREAKDRFARCESWESDARKLFLDDYKFAEADSDNGYQWPDNLMQSRELDDRPCLTVNKTRQHNLQIINDMKQNKPGVDVRPVGSGATFLAAQVFEGVIRHIEYISNAQRAYDTAAEFQVKCGVGYWRVVTDYASPDSFDQEIFVRRIRNPLTVYIDPDASESDKSDMRFAFVFDDMPKEVFKKKYPEYVDVAGATTLGNGDDWIDKDHVRVSEYFRCVEDKDKLIYYTDPQTGEQKSVRKKEAQKEMLDQVLDNPTMKMREVVFTKVEWFLIAGNKVIDKKDWLGRYIPIVQVLGEETIIEGNLDRKGHTRALKDPQRMYNYWTSASVEFVALQGKTPWLAPSEAIQGLETYWGTANTVNHAVLPYNHVGKDGKPIPPPSRPAPPQMATAYIEGLKVSQSEMQLVSGQYKEDFGAEGQAISGVAIDKRQRQGDNATYHYIDNQAIGIQFTGKIFIDLIPKIYDTPRILKILAEDGQQAEVKVDPNAQQAFKQEPDPISGAVQNIFNPNIGIYDVQAAVGPAWATRRAEAFNALQQVIQKSPDLMMSIGDVLFKNADFPGADIIADRLSRGVPANLKGEGPPPEVQQLQQQLNAVQQLLQKTTDELSKEKLKAVDYHQENSIRAYDAETKRLGAVQPGITPEQMTLLVQQAVSDALNTKSGAGSEEMLTPERLSQMVEQHTAAQQGAA